LAKNARPNNVLRTLIAIACVVIVIAGMQSAAVIIVPFLLAVFIAILASPFLFWLNRRGVPTALAILLVMILIITVVVGISYGIGTSINDFTRKLPEYEQLMREKMEFVYAQAEEWGMDLPRRELSEIINPGVAFDLAAKLLSQLGALLSNGLLILLIVVFILLEASGFPEKIRAISKNSTRSLEDMGQISDKVFRYFAIKSMTSLATGVLVTSFLMFVGIDFPILWGLLAFLFNYIPNIGSLIAAVPAVLLALLQLGLGAGISTALAYLVINSGIGSFLEPRLMGRGLGLSPMIVFLSLVFWGWVLGPVGMLLSAPLTMVVKLVLESNQETRWVSVLLGSGSQAKTITREKASQSREVQTPKEEPISKEIGTES